VARRPLVYVRLTHRSTESLHASCKLAERLVAPRWLTSCPTKLQVMA
jgi:hypothetical protein